MICLILLLLLIIVIAYLGARIFVNRRSDSVSCLLGKTAIVTGGNAGLGYSTSLLLASRGCKVIIADRDNAEKSRNKIIKATGNPNVSYKHLDLSSLQEVREFAADIVKTEGKIDLLVNNAGIPTTPDSKWTTADGLNTVMQVNYFGAFLLTHLLLDLLKASGSARIIFMGSVSIYTHNLTLDNLNLVDFDENTSRREVYANSKLCNVIAAQEFARKLQKYGITANSVDPGAVKTAIFEKAGEYHSASAKLLVALIVLFFGQESFGGAQTIFHVATCDSLKNKTGDHFSYLLPWFKPSITRNQEFCDDIWAKTEQLVNMKHEEKI